MIFFSKKVGATGRKSKTGKIRKKKRINKHWGGETNGFGRHSVDPEGGESETADL